MKPYQPISCELHSQYERMIMHAQRICLSYADNAGNNQQIIAVPIDLFARAGEEYMRFKSAQNDTDLTIRLDHIIELDPL